MASVSVRYIVYDVDAAIDFYCGQLGFHEDMHPAAAFAMLSRGPVRLVLSSPGGGPGGGQAMPDRTVPEPGGWNRFSIGVDDLESMVESLRAAGVRFRNDIVTGTGSKQILDAVRYPGWISPCMPPMITAPRGIWPAKGRELCAGRCTRRPRAPRAKPAPITPTTPRPGPVSVPIGPRCQWPGNWPANPITSCAGPARLS